jgi:aryl sulfotransferase
MPKELPIRSRDYLGPCTNTEIWDQFQLRSGDVVLSTPPKSGTTWSQAILMMLIHQQAVADRTVWNDSLWLDCNFRDQKELARRLEDQPHRRCIKSHTPLDGICYSPDATYITVYRHSIDVHFSLERHVANMKHDWLDFLFPESPASGFKRFLHNPTTDMGTDDLTLASICCHYQSFRDWAHLPNVHFFHYADMKRNPRKQIMRFAEILGLEPADSLLSAIVQASSFGQMKQVTRETAQPADGAFTDPEDFLDTGSSNKWEGRLSNDELMAYHASFSDLMGDADRQWLECGFGKS